MSHTSAWNSNYTLMNCNKVERGNNLTKIAKGKLSDLRVQNREEKNFLDNRVVKYVVSNIKLSSWGSVLLVT